MRQGDGAGEKEKTTMELQGKRLDSIVITSDAPGRLVTADDNREVIAIISDDEIICKDGYHVKMVPATNNVPHGRNNPG